MQKTVYMLDEQERIEEAVEDLRGVRVQARHRQYHRRLNEPSKADESTSFLEVEALAAPSKRPSVHFG